ncbi:unnamed protein product [Arctogadus glacialis]
MSHDLPIANKNLSRFSDVVPEGFSGGTSSWPQLSRGAHDDCGVVRSNFSGTLKLLQPAINITSIPLLTLLFRWSLLRTVISTVGMETLTPHPSGGPPPHGGAHRLIGFKVLPLQVLPLVR